MSIIGFHLSTPCQTNALPGTLVRRLFPWLLTAPSLLALGVASEPGRYGAKSLELALLTNG